MNEPISPFEIPLIIDLIGEYLSKSDYAKCILVSKNFCEQFQRLLWRSIEKRARLSQHKFSIPFTSTHTKALLANSHHIRRIRIFGDGGGELLEFIAKWPTICTNLLEFECSTFKPYGDFASLFQAITSIIQRNASLRKCSFERSDQGIKIGDYQEFFKVLSNHQSLTTLCLQDRYVGRSQSRIYRGLLQNLPPNLVSLDLAWIVGSRSELKKIPEWNVTYPHIRTMSLVLQCNDCEDTTILPFLQRCPALETLTISSPSSGVMGKLAALLGDAALFPRLSNLSLNNMDISESEWRPFAPALQGRIKTFSTKNSTFTTGSESFYKSIKPYWSETLEIIRIRRDATIEDLDIQLILTSCPNLKTFSAFINTSGRRDRRMPAASGLTVQRYIRSRWGQNDWVCLKLENLELALFDDRTGLVWEYEEMGVDTKVPQEEEAASALELFYEQLGQLTKLQHLRLGWRTVVYHFRSHLDLSIRNGLTHLEGLKDLRVLDVGCIRELKIGQKEVEWMADNWPKLKRLKGLFAKETVNYDRSIEVDFETAHDAIPRADLDKANEQGYIQWLHEKRPHIIVT